MKDLPGGPFLGLAAAARGVNPGASGMDSFPGGLPGALALSHHMSQPGFGLHHFIDPRLPFSAAAAGAFRPFLGNAAAAAAAIAASVNSSSASSSSPPQLSDSISKVSSSAFQPPIKGQTSPSSTLFSPGQNLYPRVGPAGKILLNSCMITICMISNCTNLICMNLICTNSICEHLICTSFEIIFK